jgi:glycosyltransferase involved in cell wall biosynthesis
MMDANTPSSVLHCAETIKGGIATYLRELIPYQYKSFGAGNIWILIPESQKAELAVPEGVHIETYADRGGRVSNAIRLALQALKIARREDIKIIHLHSTFAGATLRPLLAIVHRSAGIIYCAHGWAWDRPMPIFVKRIVIGIELFLSKITDRIVCISEHDKNTAIEVGISPKKLTVIHNAVNTQTPAMKAVTATWPEKKLRLLFVGRLDRQKGVDILLSALTLLDDNVHAVIAGASVLADDKNLVMPANVSKIGWLTPGELETLFANAHVLIVPSRWEGFGLIAAEAMRAGLPVIASNVGGLTEVVADQVTGIIVPAESPEALANTIKNLDITELKRMGDAGRLRVAKLFTMDRLHRELCTVYDSVMNKH